jgi:glycosyltransferase involved in cell wall biosynthesis
LLNLPTDRPLAIFVGALGNRRKGFDTLFRSWSILCQKPDWDTDLVVVGRGAEVSVWQQQAIDAGIADRMQFLGFVPDLPSILAACDLFVLPSRYEGYSLATQEALGCGIPALVSACAGIAERYPPELAQLLLPDPNDIHELCQRLQHWRCHIDYYRTTVAPFSNLLRSWTWDDMAKSIIEKIEEKEKHPIL